jgi:hypothetical protein
MSRWVTPCSGEYVVPEVLDDGQVILGPDIGAAASNRRLGVQPISDQAFANFLAGDPDLLPPTTGGVRAVVAGGRTYRVLLDELPFSEDLGHSQRPAVPSLTTHSSAWSTTVDNHAGLVGRGPRECRDHAPVCGFSPAQTERDSVPGNPERPQRETTLELVTSQCSFLLYWSFVMSIAFAGGVTVTESFQPVKVVCPVSVKLACPGGFLMSLRG